MLKTADNKIARWWAYITRLIDDVNAFDQSIIDSAISHWRCI